MRTRILLALAVLLLAASPAADALDPPVTTTMNESSSSCESTHEEQQDVASDHTYSSSTDTSGCQQHTTMLGVGLAGGAASVSLGSGSSSYQNETDAYHSDVSPDASSEEDWVNQTGYDSNDEAASAQADGHAVALGKWCTDPHTFHYQQKDTRSSSDGNTRTTHIDRTFADSCFVGAQIDGARTAGASVDVDQQMDGNDTQTPWGSRTSEERLDTATTASPVVLGLQPARAGDACTYRIATQDCRDGLWIDAPGESVFVGRLDHTDFPCSGACAPQPAAVIEADGLLAFDAAVPLPEQAGVTPVLP